MKNYSTTTNINFFLKLFIALIFIFIVSVSQADTYYNSSHITFEDTGDSFKIKILGNDFDGTNDELDDVYLYYLHPATNEWVEFFHGDMHDGENFRKHSSTTEVTSISTSGEHDEKKYGYVNFQYDQGMFPGYIIFKATVDWDIDSDENHSGIDHIFDYSIKETDMRNWEAYFSHEYFDGCNRMEFEFLTTELYGHTYTDDENIYNRHELDDIKIEYHYNDQWNTIIHGDCDNDITDTDFQVFATDTLGTVVTTDYNDGNPGIDCYKTKVAWENIPEKLLGKEIRIKVSYIWDKWANSVNLASERISFEIKQNFIEKKYAHNLNAVQNANSIDISWEYDEPGTDASFSKFEVWRYNEDGTSVRIDEITDINTKTTNDNTIPATCVEYRYKVKAFTNCSYGKTTLSEFSNTVYFQRADIPAPTNVVASVDGTNLLISWDFNPPAEASTAPTVYTVFRSVDGTGNWNLVDKVEGIESTSFIDKTATACINYVYRITVDCECSSTDPVTSTLSNVIDMPASPFNTVFNGAGNSFFDGSKGYFHDYIKLEWNPNEHEAGNVVTYEIWRKKETDIAYDFIASIENKEAHSYEDRAVDANIMYDYMFFATNNCDGSESDTAYASGFRVKTGLISGRISYEGGNPVENVELRLDSDQLIPRSALELGVNSTHIQKSKNFNELGIEPNNGFTIETYIKSHHSRSNFRPIPDFTMGFDQNRPEINIMNASGSWKTSRASEDYTINPGTWVHMAVTFIVDTSNNNYSLILYINSDSVLQQTGILSASTINGFKTSKEMLFGYDYIALDEFRLFNKIRTPDEIKRDYDRFLAGNEDGLVTYWHFDENNSNMVYDCSYKGSIYNKNHLNLSNALSFNWSTETPTKKQLAMMARTDETGKYRLPSIPYYGSGIMFTLTPILEYINNDSAAVSHTFDPSSIDLYIGDNTPVHNQVDFTDKSSFTVTGNVRYHGGDFPVENANLLLDGQIALGPDNKAVKTDSEGNYSLTVPIGSHYISVEKHGHTFLSDSSHFPYEKDPNGLPLLHEFDRDLRGINFVDSTLVKLAGKVVGGHIEQAKPLGFDKTINNIGVAEITLKITDNESYNFDIKSLNPNGLDTTSTQASIENIDGKTVRIRTNSKSGEYSVMLYPESWEITKVQVLNQSDAFNNTLEYETNINLSNVFKGQTDSIINEETNDYQFYSYNKKHNFLYFAPQTISVTRPDNSPFRGEDSIQIGNDYIHIWDSITQTSTLGNALFETMHKYYTLISVQEQYNNYDGQDTITTNIPVGDVNITISNAFELPTEEGITTFVTTDSLGKAPYSFICSVPEVDGGPILQSLKLYTASAEWPVGSNYQAYVIGNKPLPGADFYSAGPEVEIILRDPPGSNSYAFIEKGSTFTTTEKWNTNSNSSNTLGGKTKYGLKFETGLGFTSETNIINNTQGGVTYETTTNDKGERVKTLNFTERFSTSSSPLDEGFMADVFIGHAKNMLISKTNNLEILEKQYCLDNNINIVQSFTYGNKEYCFAKRDGYAVNDPDINTYFAYSQRYIIETEIPKITNLKYALLADTTSGYASHIPFGNRFYGYSNSDIYYLYDTPGKLRQEDKNFLDSIYSVVNDSLRLSYSVSSEDLSKNNDKIYNYNNHIQMWYSALAKNETEKAIALNHNEMNISFDGSSGPRSLELSESLSYDEQSEIVKKYHFTSESHQGAVIFGAGVELISSSKSGKSISNTVGETEEQKVTFGFVLDDNNQGDAYSVNVNKINSQSMLISGDQLEKLNAPERYDDVANTTESSIRSGVSLSWTIAGWISKSVKGVAIKNVPFGYVIGAVNYAIGAAYQVVDFVNLYEKKSSIQDAQDLSEWRMSGFSVSSPIFEVVGGRTMCPYTPEYSSSLYVDDNSQHVVLSGGTWQRDVPGILVDSLPFSVKTNIPANKKAYFELMLKNESVTESDQYYVLEIDDSTTNGAILSIDGYNPNRSFYVPYGQSLIKTLAVEMGSEDVYEYDSIRLIFHSQCQYNPQLSNNDIFDEAYISVKFKPVCTDAGFNNLQDNWLLSNSFDEMNLEINNYDLQNSEFSSISLQYKKPANQAPQNAFKWFVNNDNFYNEALNGDDSLKVALIGGESSLFYNFSAESLDLDNQEYLVRLKTTCYDNEGELYTHETPYISGIVDRNQPQVFGLPAPQDGVLSPGDEIAIQFNEPIESGLVVTKNISVEGVLNNIPASNNTSIYFDGQTSYTKITQGISLSNKSFTIMFNAKRTVPNDTEVFYSHGNSFELGMINADTLYWKIGSKVLKSSIKSTSYDPTKWNTYAFAYNHIDSICYMTRVNYWEPQTISISHEEISTINNIVNEDVVLGKGQNPSFKGTLNNLSVWNKYLSNQKLNEYTKIELVGNEIGLKGYWPMNEGHGELAIDKTGHRQMSLNANWTVENENLSLNCDSSSLAIPFRFIEITNESDLTMEFWFKALAPSETQYLFSRGVGDNSEDPLSMNNAECMSISVDPDGNLQLTSNGETHSLVNTNYFDNSWHHFTLVVNRKSNIKSFIDGKLQKTLDVNLFSALAGETIWLGAKGLINGGSTITSDFFKGKIDDFRIWSLARNTEQILLDYNSRLKGTEKGLMVYLPFEDFNDTYNEFQPSLKEMCNDSTTHYTRKNVLVTDANEACSDDVPIIKLSRPVTQLSSIGGQDYSYVVGEDKIIIELNNSTAEKRALTEHCTLFITVDEIKDKNGNELDPKATWIAHVNQNPLTWSQNRANYEYDEDQNYEFTQKIINTGGLAKEYEIINLPNWLSVSHSVGVIDANSELDLTFTIDETLNTGNYDEVIYLKTDFGYNERFDVSVKVKAQTPDWFVDSDEYTSNMSIIAQLKIDKSLSTDEDDMVGVFINNQCRGVSQVEYFPNYDLYLVFLEVSGNISDDSSKIDFRVFDASQGTIHTNVVCMVDTFYTNKIYGMASDPIIIETTNEKANYIPTVDGWTWISFNLQTNELSDVNKILSTINSNTSSEVRGQGLNNSAGYLSSNYWAGDLVDNGGFEIGKMYMLKGIENQLGIYSGTPVDPDTTNIIINKNWNWIGYTPEFKMSVNNALTYLNASHGDLIKSKSKFAIYDDVYGWIGSLNYLETGFGYMYKSLSEESKTFHYPKQAFMKSGSTFNSEKIDPIHNKYALNMNLIVKVIGIDNLNGKELRLMNNKGEVVKAIPTHYGNELLYFLTAHGDNKPFNIEFHLFDASSNKSIVSINSVEFKSNTVVGSLTEPFAVSFNGNALSNDFNSVTTITVHPNPFSEYTLISGLQKGNSYAIVDILGKTIKLWSKVNSTSVTWHASDKTSNELRSGTYFLINTSNTINKPIKVIYIK